MINSYLAFWNNKHKTIKKKELILLMNPRLMGKYLTNLLILHYLFMNRQGSQ